MLDIALSRSLKVVNDLLLMPKLSFKVHSFILFSVLQIYYIVFEL